MKLYRPYYSGFAVTVTVLCFVVGARSDDKLSRDETLAVKKFYEMVKDGMTQEYQHDEKYLIRWIRARNFDLEAAAEMLRRNYQWRKENRMDFILKENFDVWEKRTPIVFAFDYEGRPAITVGLGQIDLRRIVLAGEKDQVDRYVVYAYERGEHEVIKANNRTGKNIMDGYLVFDLAGFTTRSHACLACISTIVLLVTNYERHYPQLGRRVFIVNAPRIFEVLLNNFLRPVMSPHTAKALRVYGFNRQEWKAELLKFFPENELVPALGGTLKIPRKP